MGILRHKIVDYIRRSSRQKDENANWINLFLNDTCQWKDEPIDRKSDPAAILENRAFWQVLEKCLGNLTEPVAQTFVLRVMEEFTPDQVCQKLDINQANLWSRLHRARTQLRQSLESNWFNI